MKKLPRKIRQIWAVLTWDDAEVFRKGQLASFVVQFSPTISGTGAGMSCSECQRRWDGNGLPLEDGHTSWCRSTRIREFLSLLS